MSDWYTHSGFPATGSSGSSASMRAELDAIAAAFAKLPAITGNANKLLRVNSTATAVIGSNFSLTEPATGCTLTIADTKTLTANNTLTLSGTDGSTLNVGVGGNAMTDTVVHALVEKTALVAADEIAVLDSAATPAYSMKKAMLQDVWNSVWTALGSLINGGTAKTTPVAADALPLMDSAAGNATKKLLFSDLLTTLYGYVVKITSATGSAAIPAGTTAQRDATPAVGYSRFNTTLGHEEYWNGSAWVSVLDSSITREDNPIINGAMEVDQANSGAAVSVAPNTSPYSVDMWQGLSSVGSGVFSLQQQSATPPAGFKNYLRATVTTADGAPGATVQYAFMTKVEGVNWSRYSFGGANAKSVTLSFMARASVAGTYSGALSNGAANRAYPFQFTIAAANTWQYVTVTIAGDTAGTWATDNTIGAILYIDMGSGSNALGTANAWGAANYIGATGSAKLMATLNATFDITGVQIEAGTVASPFKHRTYDEKLRRCQRYLAYFESAAGAAYPTASGANAQSIATFPTLMRTTPTITLGAFTSNNVASDSVLTVNSRAIVYQVVQGASAGNYYGYRSGNKADARL